MNSFYPKKGEEVVIASGQSLTKPYFTDRHLQTPKQRHLSCRADDDASKSISESMKCHLS